MTLLEEVKNNPFIGTLKDIDLIVSKKDYKRVQREGIEKKFRSVIIRPYQRHWQQIDPITRYYMKVVEKQFWDSYNFHAKLHKIYERKGNKNLIVKFRKYGT